MFGWLIGVDWEMVLGAKIHAFRFNCYGWAVWVVWVWKCFCGHYILFPVDEWSTRELSNYFMRSVVRCRLDADRLVQSNPARDFLLEDPTSVWWICPLGDRQRMYYHVIDLVSIGAKLLEPCKRWKCSVMRNIADIISIIDIDGVFNSIHTLHYLISVNNNEQHALKA